MESMGLKALVTGGTGFIGYNLIKELVKRNWKVYALVRKKSSLGNKRLCSIKNLKYIYAEDIFKANYEELHETNLANENYMKTLPQFDVCFHLASYGVDYKQQDVYEIIDGNIKFTMKVIELCKKNGTKKVINTGSCFEYGLNEGKLLNEGQDLKPHSYYSIAKVACEQMTNLYCKTNNISAISVRPFGVFGETEGFHRFVPQLMRTAIRGEKMKMTYGEQVRDYLYVEDLVDAYISLALADVPLYEAYNICSGIGVKIKDLAIEVASFTNIGLDLFDFGAIPYRKNEVMYFVGDNSKIKKYTAWEPRYTLKQGLKKTYEWYKANWEEI